MSINVPLLGSWLGEKLSRNSEEITKDQMENMTRAELTNTIVELQGKLKAANEADPEETDEKRPEDTVAGDDTAS